jgi:hypothetical protein
MSFSKLSSSNMILRLMQSLLSKRMYDRTPDDLISQVIAQEARDMTHELKDCPHDGYSVFVTDDCVFSGPVKDWLEQQVGPYGSDWCWNYQWMTSDQFTEEVFVINDQRCQISVVFSHKNHYLMFMLRWSDRCISAVEK